MKIIKTSLIIIALLSVMIFITGCTIASIKDVKNPDYVGKKITVSGTVQDTIKVGEISGYTIKDKTDTIKVSSQSLPAEGSNISVTGILIKDTIFGYYIKAD